MEEKEIEELLKELTRSGDDGLKALGITVEDIRRAIENYYKRKKERRNEEEEDDGLIVLT